MTLGPAAACLPIVAAIFAARTLARDWRGWGVALPVTLGATAGVSSVVFWLLLIAPIESRAHLVVADTLIWAGVTAFLAWRAFAREASFSAAHTATSVSASDARRVPVVVWLAAGLALAFAGVAVVRVAGSPPSSPATRRSDLVVPSGGS